MHNLSFYLYLSTVTVHYTGHVHYSEFTSPVSLTWGSVFCLCSCRCCRGKTVTDCFCNSTWSPVEAHIRDIYCSFSPCLVALSPLLPLLPLISFPRVSYLISSPPCAPSSSSSSPQLLSSLRLKSPPLTLVPFSLSSSSAFCSSSF